MKQRIIAALAVVALAVPAGVALANPGPNIVAGTMGNDILVGTNQEDVVIGFAGNDVLVGGKKHDVLRGGVGNDRIHTWAALSGPDTLIGGGGRFDRCVGGPEDTFGPSCEWVILRDTDGTIIRQVRP